VDKLKEMLHKEYDFKQKSTLEKKLEQISLNQSKKKKETRLDDLDEDDLPVIVDENE
jgi:hypothetical protein